MAKKIFRFCLMALLFASRFGFCDEYDFFSHLDGGLGASFGIGELGNTSMGSPMRWMDVLSIEAMPGYRVDNWLFGVDFDYRWQGQLTSIGNAGGTNLKGHSYLFGVGANYRFTPKLSLQAAIDFVGRYDFGLQTGQSQNVNLSGPLGLRVKGQYHFPELPISLDLDLQYLTFRNLVVQSVSNRAASNFWMVGVGFTFFFREYFAPQQKQNQKRSEPVPSEV